MKINIYIYNIYIIIFFLCSLYLFNKKYYIYNIIPIIIIINTNNRNLQREMMIHLVKLSKVVLSFGKIFHGIIQMKNILAQI